MVRGPPPLRAGGSRRPRAVRPRDKAAPPTQRRVQTGEGGKQAAGRMPSAMSEHRLGHLFRVEPSTYPRRRKPALFNGSKASV